ncbi:chorismate mutase [Streptococcus sciuri]|uniref:Chorismate mutase n=1 Tax=Streptococcus sciuri TaxID=2973939 RepID=A0ABT2F4I7_9STRE|nr:chorismate mutase [Streptococcus sciuri]MCS4487371.1 chorismate mutase [Streptococcus sciuri]
MNLVDIRKAIDTLDKDLVTLLEKRIQLVSEVVAYKKATETAIFDKEREKAILDKVAFCVINKEFEETIVAIFADIMKQSRLYQEKQMHD